MEPKGPPVVETQLDRVEKKLDLVYALLKGAEPLLAKLPKWLKG